jgi:hypothetical protein
MFDVRSNQDFDRRGSLRSSIEFSFCGDVKAVSVRKKSRYNATDDEPTGDTYYIILEDAYGFQCSFFRARMSLETAQGIAAKIPYDKTLMITGSVAVRKGNTYFNAHWIKYPDGSDVIGFTAIDGCCEPEEEKTINY